MRKKLVNNTTKPRRCSVCDAFAFGNNPPALIPAPVQADQGKSLSGIRVDSEESGVTTDAFNAVRFQTFAFSEAVLKTPTRQHQLLLRTNGKEQERPMMACVLRCPHCSTCAIQWRQTVVPRGGRALQFDLPKFRVLQ